MSNTYFQFKQFIINQERCAMKVCTDSCLFGAWISTKLSGCRHVLDIGSGSGLLMLMAAQNSDAHIEGIEVDHMACQQSIENVFGSSWAGRLHVYEGDIRTVKLDRKYDLIMTNPPFYESDLIASSAEKNLARHSTALTFEDLISAIVNNLEPAGRFGILLPYHRSLTFEGLALDHGFHLHEKCLVRQTISHGFFRSMMLFGRQYAPVALGEVTIKDNAGNYSADFADLMRDYYLHI